MYSLIKNLVPRRFKINPNSAYNYLRRISGVARYRYNALKNFIDNNPQVSRLFPEEIMQRHYAYEPMLQTTEFPTLYVNQIRYYRMYEYFQTYYPDLFRQETRIIDVGDTSGVLFRAMGRDGLSVNIHQDVVDCIRQNGIQAEVQDAEVLSYSDKSFDYGFCFQCLEHLKNPLRALDEIGRVVKRKVFLSIPYVKKTSISSKNFMVNVRKISKNLGGFGKQAVRDTECHIFEFSTKDMINVLSFSRLEYIDNFTIDYFTPLGATRTNKSSYINFFILKPRDTDGHG